MVSSSLQASCFAILGAGLLCLGYLCGRSASGGQQLLFPGNETAHQDFDPSQLTDELIQQLNDARASIGVGPLSNVTLHSQQFAAAELHISINRALAALSSSFHADEHAKLLRALGLLQSVDERLYAALRAVMPLAAERLPSGGESAAAAAAVKSRGTWLLNVIVRQKPFGMHIKRGTLEVMEVFPGFPAQQVGVRKGCKLKEIGRQKVTAGTWLEVFQSRTLPFPMRLACSRRPTKANVGNVGPLSEEEHRYRVMVTKKPYGMNVQVNTVPRVVEVLPGYPAEAAGVRPGFVLTEVSDVAVNVDNWFEHYQAAKLPFTLTFDPKVPILSNNSYFRSEQDDVPGGEENSTQPLPGTKFTFVECTVKELPFGMQVKALRGKQPLVVGVLPDKPAFRAGVRVGDELMEVAGRNVTWETWFAAMQQAVAPYGLLFRRSVEASER